MHYSAIYETARFARNDVAFVIYVRPETGRSCTPTNVFESVNLLFDIYVYNINIYTCIPVL